METLCFIQNRPDHFRLDECDHAAIMHPYPDDPSVFSRSDRLCRGVRIVFLAWNQIISVLSLAGRNDGESHHYEKSEDKRNI